ncbi:Hypothetical protein LUCI_0807 [Lucifera butyrica]|uniref:Uncharacterized protein n=1 Tax=Lucifera butyrica TaxID=1351585 RepID=A0A498R423_9FIRM|nr:ATP-binding protein [Lucifera butyrica]VBB05597.1 Hypothetical protein LUCI_0807 [Lucifera butyrica]
MIHSIEFHNFKGQADVQELSGKDLFIGRNGSGKTTRVQALGLSMLGYIPGEEKTAAGTFKYATGDTMTVGLKTGDFQFTRTFGKEEKKNNKTGETTISIKETLVVAPGRGERNDTAKKARVSSEIGNFPVMLDFNEFLQKTDTQRRDFIYSLSPIASETWDREKIHRYLVDKLLTVELQENNAEQYETMQELITQTIEKYPVGFGVQDGLQAMLDWVGAEKQLWDRKKADAQGAVRQFADLKNSMDETDRNILGFKTELEDLQRQLIEVEKILAADEQKVKANAKQQQRTTELQQLIADLNANVVNADTSGIDRQIAEHQGQILQPPAVEGEMQQLQAKRDTMQDERNALVDKQQNVGLKIKEIAGQVAALEGALGTTGTMKGRCMINPMIACPKDFSGFGDYVAKQKEKATETVAAFKAEAAGYAGQIKKLDADLKAVGDQQTALMKQIQEVNARNTSINQSISELMKQKNAILAAASDRQNKLKLYQDELNKLLATPLQPVTSVELSQSRANGIKTRMDVLKKTIGEKEKAKQAILMLQQSAITNRKAEYNSVCLKLIQETLGLKGIKGELVKELLDPICNDITANLSLMGFAQCPFFQTESDTGKEIFQFGWINEKGHRVNFDALSTGQQTVFLAAMMVTVIDRAQPKLHVLVMDNLNHLDHKNFQMLIDGLSKIKDKLDNILLAGAIEFPFTADGWKVWDLSPVAEMLDTDSMVIDDAEVKKSA